jgi:hypothetical protein
MTNDILNELYFKDYTIYENIPIPDDKYYCFLKNNNKIIKVVFRKKLYDMIKLDIIDIQNDQPLWLTDRKIKEEKIFFSHENENEIIKNLSDFNWYKNQHDTFFCNHYNNLKGFPKLLEIFEDYYIFEFIEGNHLDLNINYENDILKDKIFELSKSNFDYCYKNKIYIDYEYDLSNIIIDDMKDIYFLDIENFIITYTSKWNKIHIPNTDPIIYKEPILNKLNNLFS